MCLSGSLSGGADIKASHGWICKSKLSCHVLVCCLVVVVVLFENVSATVCCFTETRGDVCAIDAR